MKKYRKIPMGKPHCAAHPRCYEPPKFNVTGVLGDYCERHADETIALRERLGHELVKEGRITEFVVPATQGSYSPVSQKDQSDV